MVVALVFAVLGVVIQGSSCSKGEPENSPPKSAPLAQELSKEWKQFKRVGIVGPLIKYI
jgi:hypothetical protein